MGRSICLFDRTDIVSAPVGVVTSGVGKRLLFMGLSGEVGHIA